MSRRKHSWRTRVEWSPEALRNAQEAPLDAVLRFTLMRIAEWMDTNIREIPKAERPRLGIAFSGGLDSTVLLHLTQRWFGHEIEVVPVFVDTGLEFPEVRRFAMQQTNVQVIKPEKHFREVIRQFGYPVISKQVARYISDVQNPTPRNAATRHLRLTGHTQDGKHRPAYAIPKRWRFVAKAPFRVSDKCCHALKTGPLDRAWKEQNLFPLRATRAEESDRRTRSFLRHKCTRFDTRLRTNAGYPVVHGQPMFFWTRQHVLEYLLRFGVSYPTVYGEIERAKDGTLHTTGEQRTGCVFCMLGVHHDPKGQNRFQRLERSHPQLHNYAMTKLGLKEVLEFLGIPHSNTQLNLFQASSLPTRQTRATRSPQSAVPPGGCEIVQLDLFDMAEVA